MFAYQIQCHKHIGHVSRLIRWLYHTEDLFIVSVDTRSGEDLSPLRDLLALGNVLLVAKHAITWGGASLVASMLSTIFEALSHDGWRYFVNISESDMPLKSRPEMLEFFANHASKGAHNFISDFGVIEFEPLPRRSEDAGLRWTLSAPGNSSFTLHDDVCRLLRSGATSHSEFPPVTQPNLRSAFHVEEDIEGGRLFIRPHQSFEAYQAERFFARYPYRFGRQWIVASRALCRYMIDSEASRSIFNVLKNSFIPDESFTQTVAATAPREDIGGIVANNLRYALGAPERITDANFAEVLASGALFARKVDFAHCTKMIEWAEVNLGNLDGPQTSA